jgi:predicted GIY-YIG superfamily endonuclease
MTDSIKRVMAGFSPATHDFVHAQTRKMFARCTASSFTRRYKLYRPVYSEPHGDMRTAIKRETSLKRWPRAWNVRLIVAGNPDWNDLSVGLM